MKLISALWLCFLFACSVSNSSEHRLISEHENIRHIQNSVVSIFNRNETTGTLSGPLCTGFFISETRIVTAFHCIKTKLEEEYPEIPYSDRTFPIMTREHFDAYARTDGIVAETYDVGLIAFDDDSDVAILELTFDIRSEYFLRLSDRALLEGETVYSMGMPRGQPWVLTQGIISSLHPAGSRFGNILHQASIAPGSSGGPLLDNNGLVVGLNVALVDGATFIAVAKPVQKIKILLSGLDN